MSEWIVYDGLEDRCFGCGQRNEHGLRLRFLKMDDGSVQAEYTSPDWYGGAEGVVHGGIQAAMLDEVLGVAAHLYAGDTRFNLVTADFRLRYRRPAPTTAPLLIRGRIARVEEPSYFVEGEIVDPKGHVLTEAEARWRRLD